MGYATSEFMKEGVVAQLNLSRRGGSPLSYISLSGDQRHGVVGGRELMKVIRLTPDGLTEIATLKNRNSLKKGGAAGQVSMYDMAWCPSGGRVAASLSSGEIATWDLGHLSVDPADAWGSGDGTILGSHTLGAYRLSWNNHDHAQLLSGSQDGLLKMWDMRHKSEAAVFRPKNGSARDVQFSPRGDFKFAAVFDNGKLQIWDYRYIEQPFMKVNISIKTTLAVEWHPTIPWRIATGSHDRMVKIWDLDENTGQRNRVPPIKGHRSMSTAAAAAAAAASMEQTLDPFATIHCPAPVSRLKWRPGHENQIALTLDAQMRGSLAAIMVHDITDPWVPLVALHGGGSLKTGFCWLDTPSRPPPLSLPPPLPPAAPLPPSAATMTTSTSTSSSAVFLTGTEAAFSSSPAGRSGYAEGWGGMGVWQHMVSCSEQGIVSVHSLPRSIQPRLRLGPCAFHASARGEILASTHKVDHNPASWSIYLNEDTQAAPGIFCVVAPNRTYPPFSPTKIKNPRGATPWKMEERRRSPTKGATASGSGSSIATSGIASSGMPPPQYQQNQPHQQALQQQQQHYPPQQLVQQQYPPREKQHQSPQLQPPKSPQLQPPQSPQSKLQHHQYYQPHQRQKHLYSMAPIGAPAIPASQAQRIARSLSVGDQTGGVKGRRSAAAVAGVFPSVSHQPTGDFLSSRSPKQMPRGQSLTMVAVPPLALGSGRGTLARDVGTNQRPGRGGSLHQTDAKASRGRLTMFPVSDTPVALDKARWRHTPATSIWAPGPRSTMSGGHMDPGPQLTEMLATSYAFRGHHVRDLCACNADVCLAMGLLEMAYTWHEISILLAGIPGGVPVPLGHSRPHDLLVALASGGRTMGASGEAASGGGGGGEVGMGLEDGAGDGGEATIPMPEVLEKLIKSDAEAYHLHQHQQHYQAQQQRHQERRDRHGHHRSHVQRIIDQTVASPASALMKKGRADTASSTTRGIGSRTIGSNSRGGGGGGDGSNALTGASDGMRNDFPPSFIEMPRSSSSLSSSSHPTVPRRPSTGATAAAAASLASMAVGKTEAQNLETEKRETVADLWEDLPEERGPSARGSGGSGSGGCCGHGRGERLPDELVLPHWAAEVAEVVRNRVEAGDVFHAVAICEVVRSWYFDTGPGRGEDIEEPLKGVEEIISIEDRCEGLWLSTAIPKLEVREWYVECLDILHRYQLFGPETELILHSDDPYISQIHKKNTTSYARCSKCGSSHSSGTMCAKCRRPTSVCPVCDCPVHGHYVGCQGCNHLGHYHHMKEWFENEEVCPHDKCDHVCAPKSVEDRFEFHRYY